MNSKIIDILNEYAAKKKKIPVNNEFTEEEKTIINIFNDLIKTIDETKEFAEKTREKYRKMMLEANARFEEKVNEFSFLRRIGEEGFVSTDLTTLCNNFLDIILEETGAEHGSIMLIEKEKNTLKTIVANGIFYEKNSKLKSFPVGEGIAGYAAESGEIVYVKNAPEDERFVSYKHTPGSLISAPIKYENETLGILNISHSEINFFDRNLLLLLPIILNQMALSIKNSFFYKETADINKNLEKIVKQRTEQLLVEKEKSDKLSLLNRSIINNLTGGIIVINKDQEVILANQKALSILNYNDIRDIQKDLNSDGRLKELYSLYSQILASDSINQFQRTEFIIKGKKEDRIMGTSISKFFENNKVAGAIANFRDITDKKRMSRINADNDRQRIVANMISKIAHQIRNPLNSIQGFAQLLQMELENTEGIREHLVHIFNGIHTIDELINNVMFYTNPINVKYDSFSLKEPIEDILKLYDLELAGKNIIIEKKYTVRKGNIINDKVIFRTILFNLIGNAVEYVSDKGKIKIQIEPYDDNKIIFTIENDMEKLDENDVLHLAEPFFSAPKTNNKLGLGLAVVQKLCNTTGIELKILPNKRCVDNTCVFSVHLILPFEIG